MGKNAFLIILAILLVGGSFVFAEYRNKKSLAIYKAPEVTIEVGNTVQDLDTDGDGIKDWEEILLGTNPKDPKSKSSPAAQTSIAKDLTKKTEELSPIDLVSREFFARYMELRQLGFAGDKLNQQDLAQRTIGNIVISQPAVYKINEILTKPDNGNEGVRQYANQVGSLFKKYAIKSRNEAVIAKEALENEEPDILKEIDPIIVSYKNIVNSLIKVEVPKSMATIHLDLVNAMNENLFVAQSFRDLQINPFEGMQALKYHQLASENLYNSINAIKSYLTYLGIYENVF